MANKNVAWVEPNLTYRWSDKISTDNIDTMQDRHYEMTPPLENYCIAIDLEVEIAYRKQVNFSEAKKVILCSWTTKAGETDGSVSFFSGTKHHYGNSNVKNYLTTDPTTFGTFDEVKLVGTNECFGIKSIDVQYNNYSVPEVTIEFTDIRGISLFSPEELRHQGVNEDGIVGMTDATNDIAGSFFKCFFTFPYPKFNLMVKGFYGEPTSYELTVSDFRASFDCNTGNFNATAKFVGYSYSLLSDITMNALVVAPLNEYEGKSYWENKHFTFTDGTEIPTINDVVKKIGDLKDKLAKHSSFSSDAQKAKDLDVLQTKITSTYGAYSNFFNELIKDLNKYKIDNANNPFINYSKRQLVFIRKKSTNSIDIKLNEQTIKYFNDLEDSVKSFGNNLETKLTQLKVKNNILTEISYNDNIQLIENIDKNYGSYFSSDFFSTESDKIYIWIYDGSNLEEELNRLKSINDNEIKIIQKKIANEEQQLINQVLEFSPTVENVTKMLMAHFDTLMHSIYYATNTISNRTATSLGIKTTDLVLQKEQIGAFPRVDVENTYNGVTVTEEGWIADLSGGKHEPEVKLIEGLLKAVNVFQTTANETGQKMINSNSETINNNTVMEIPLSPLDVVITKHPFGDNLNFSDISDFIGRLGLRMCSLFGISKFIDSTDVKDAYKMGNADAINFKGQYPHPSKGFLKRLCGGVNSINGRFIKYVLINSNNVRNEMINGKWAWNGDNETSATGLFTTNTLNKYKVNVNNNEQVTLLPICGIDWNNINANMISSEGNKDTNDYISTRHIEDSFCPNIFKLDLNYNKYGGYKSKMCLDNEPFSYTNKFNLEFDAQQYLKTYYYDNQSLFGKCFSESSSDNITYSQGVGSHTIPSAKTQDYIETFTTNKSYESIFDTIKDGSNLKSFYRLKGSFNDAANEIDCVTTFTVPTFRGIKSNNKFEENWSIFGQKSYYNLATNEAKALVFLDSLKLKEEMINSGGIRFDNYMNDGDKNILAHIINDNNSFDIMPYCGLLLLGGYYWKEEYMNSTGIDPLVGFVNTTHAHEAVTYSLDKAEVLFSLRKEITDTLKKEFIEWANSNDGFGYYQSQFEIQPINGSSYNTPQSIIDEISRMLKSNNGKCTVVKFLMENVSDEFFNNYISFKTYEGNLKLFNRETSTAVKMFTKFLLKPCMVIKPTKYIFNNYSNDIVCFNSLYIDGFIKKLKELYQTDYENINNNDEIINPIRTNDDIKISLYKYIKILYDKWLSGTKESDWTVENFFENNWHFIDSYYNNIGDRTYINIEQFCEDILYSQNKNGYSLLSFLSKTLATSRFMLHCVQNFMNLNISSESAKFERLFDAVPYNEIDFKNINIHPSFIAMYTYEYSSKLDISDSVYNGDSFDISSDNPNDLPTPISTKDLTKGYRVPAFAVSYGKQYQSYFKDIQVSMDNPIVTEQSLKAQFMIASMNGKNSENGKKVGFLGQDLYTIYSNNSYTCTVKMMGCAWIQPLMYFQLTNVPMFKGAYLIQKVTHHIEPGNMETTFVGTRMAKVTTPIVEDPLVINDNNQVSPQMEEIIEGSKAEVTNNCKYKFFNPKINGDNIGMPQTELDMTLDAYEQYVGHKFDTNVKNIGGTVRELIARVINSEAENQDTLGKELVATVLFNRYMYYGKDLTKVIYGKQHAYNKKYNNDSLKIADKIFTNSPIILVGEKTYVGRQVPILKNYQSNGALTNPITLTPHMVKSMDGYCTTRGYDKNDKSETKKENVGWWHQASYMCQHDNSKGTLGHVFVAGAFQKGEIEYWQEPQERNGISNSFPSKEAKNLYEAIKHTIEFSNSLTIKSLSMEKDIANDADVFYINAKPNDVLVDVFDAIVNTYYDYFSECCWVVSNDASEKPSKIRVKANSDSKIRKISIGSLNLSGKYKPYSQDEGLNDFFYTILKKKYNAINGNNKETFKIECINFTNLISNDANWVQKVNNLLSVSLQSCDGKEVNLPILNGYSWDGDNSIGNQNKPKDKFESYDKALASNEALKNVVGRSGNCAAYVRKAMEKGLGQSFTHPNSACVYSKFMQYWGFSKVYEGFGQSSEGYTPENGDIAVVAGTNVKQHGHIHIYNANEKVWCSDIKCKMPWCYSDKGRPYIVYRWIGKSNA